MGKKKERIKYVDDGRTIADMTGVKSGPRLGNANPRRPRPKAKEVWQTYWQAVKLMVGPLLVFLVGLCIVYMIAFAIFSLA